MNKSAQEKPSRARIIQCTRNQNSKKQSGTKRSKSRWRFRPVSHIILYDTIRIPPQCSA